jgi:endonuclease/exonuclease/phosphatase (EEP) superfamily protein YafD
VIHAVALVLIAGTATASLLGLCGSLWWVLDLASHFRVQYLLVLVLGAWLATIARRWALVGTALIFLLLNAWMVAPCLAPRPRPGPLARTSDGDRLRVLFVNVHTSNQQTERVARLIRHTHADVVGLMEINRRWSERLGPALAPYTHRMEQPRDDNFGIGLYSRLPWLDARVQRYGNLRLPSLRARVRLARSAVTLLFTHPTPPTSARYAHLRRLQLEAIYADRPHLPEPLVVFGDLNASPWSRDFRWFRRRMRLVDTRRGFGPQRTWPANSWLLRIPIDHCLVSPSIGVRSRRLGPNVGSDHLPVIVDLVVPPRK